MQNIPQAKDCTVMIVDDSHFMRETLRSIYKEHKGHSEGYQGK